MGCNKFRRAQQIADVFEKSGMDFEFFPYYEIFRFSNEDGQKRIIDHSLNLMALVWDWELDTPGYPIRHRRGARLAAYCFAWAVSPCAFRINGRSRIR